MYLKLLEDLGFSNDKNDNSDGLSIEDGKLSVDRIISLVASVTNVKILTMLLV